MVNLPRLRSRGEDEGKRRTRQDKGLREMFQDVLLGGRKGRRDGSRRPRPFDYHLSDSQAHNQQTLVYSQAYHYKQASLF